MAQAVFDLFPGAKYAIGPAIADGFYYDFELPDGQHFSDTDLERIEARMREIVAEDEPFVREEYDFDRGLELFADQPYKQEIIRNVSSGAAEDDDAGEVTGDGTVGVYKNLHADGSVAYVDLCRGPHVPSTGKLGAFKLTKVAGAYWRGDEKRPMLQRIYGTAWESDKALKEYLHRLEEAERRDHRKLGAELDLFSFPDEIGSGLAVFHPKGGTIRRIMEDYSRQRHIEAGYDFVNSPHITKSNLFEESGHLDWYAEGMYPPMELDGGTDYYLKPMNCPFHILIFESHTRSYRELPLRLLRVRDGLPLREVGRGARADARAGPDPGRRAHLHDQGDDGRRDRVAAQLRPRRAARLRARRLLPRAVDQARGEGGRHGRGVGRGDRGAARGRVEDRPRARDGPGRRRVLRAEDLGAGPRRDRPDLADVDDPARLPAARSASTCTTSAPTTSGTGRS